MESPRIEDRGSHLEVSLSATGFGHASFVDVLAAASKLFGAKPILLICDDTADTIGPARAYDVGVELSMKLPLGRIAIALRGRKSSTADRFTELVAENRGTQVRYFESVERARAWLGVS
jgi:hypothetical protein